MRMEMHDSPSPPHTNRRRQSDWRPGCRWPQCSRAGWPRRRRAHRCTTSCAWPLSDPAAAAAGAAPRQSRDQCWPCGTCLPAPPPAAKTPRRPGACHANRARAEPATIQARRQSLLLPRLKLVWRLRLRRRRQRSPRPGMCCWPMLQPPPCAQPRARPQQPWIYPQRDLDRARGPKRGVGGAVWGCRTVVLAKPPNLASGRRNAGGWWVLERACEELPWAAGLDHPASPRLPLSQQSPHINTPALFDACPLVLPPGSPLTPPPPFPLPHPLHQDTGTAPASCLLRLPATATMAMPAPARGAAATAPSHSFPCTARLLRRRPRLQPVRQSLTTTARRPHSLPCSSSPSARPGAVRWVGAVQFPRCCCCCCGLHEPCCTHDRRGS